MARLPPYSVTEESPLHVEERPAKRAKLSSSAASASDFPSVQQRQFQYLKANQSLSGNGNGIQYLCSSSSARPRPRAGARRPSYHHNRSFTSAAVKGVTVAAAAAASPPWRPDDKEGHYVFNLGDNLTPRYKILSKMGQGTFGQVLECWDRETKQFVAVKIVRALQKYCEEAMIEIDVLCKVAKHDRSGTRCVQMRNWFEYRNHICIVFEKLGPSLYDFLRRNNYRPFPIDLVREFGRQLLDSVAYMHDLNLIHTDLKPENILLVSSDYVKVPDNIRRISHDGMDIKRLPKSSAIKLIDFGSATSENQDHSSVICTRHYRAPEVILGIGWSYPCDLWSVGCILVELCTGETLFQTHENLEHLAMMERVLGPLPIHMIKKADRHSSKYFRRGTRLNWPQGASSRESIRSVRKLFHLQNLIMQHVDKSVRELIDLLQGLLKFEPSERFSAHEALRHPFFTKDC